LDDVTIAQAIEIPLVKSGVVIEESKRTAPVVAGKKALFRVYATPEQSAHEVGLRLTLKNSRGTTHLTTSKTLAKASQQADLDSTFNIIVDPELIAADTQYAVELTEAEACDAPRGRVRFPESGERDLDATETGVVRVLLVPIVTLGGSPPFADQALVDLFASEGNARYPSTKFEITLADKTFESKIRLGTEYNEGWQETLDAFHKYMVEETVKGPFDLHYFGLLGPTGAPRSVTGLASGSGRVASSGIGFSLPGLAAEAAETFVHELGHMHSLKHSPGCGSDNVSSYPVADGKLDAFGWDSRSNQLLDPAQTWNIMSYCHPLWTSAFTYKSLARYVSLIAIRSEAYDLAEPKFAEPSRFPRYDTVIVDRNGGSRFGTHVRSRIPPDGEPEIVQARDSSGRLLATTVGYRLSLDDAGAAFVRVRDVQPNWATIHVRGTSALVVAERRAP
jgi:hypothetical protein